VASATVATDPLDYWARNELILIARERRNTGEAEKRLRELKALLGNAAQTYLDIGLDYANAGLWDEATDWLMRLVPDAQTLVYPMVSYALAYVAEQTGHDDKARECYKRAPCRH
ncbi:MAG: hypothetical protein M1546_15000, partial [Chloroflexi bacterium]|nr:hypothetical protein [Chloroflexota bacterium]